MALRFTVRPLAEADIDSAAQWYESERQGLAARFLTDLDRAFTRIEEHPIQFPEIAGGIRRTLLHTFPYAVYFSGDGSSRDGDSGVAFAAKFQVWKARLRM